MAQTAGVPPTTRPMRQSWASAISVTLICTLLVNACGAPVRPLQRQHVEQARLKKQSVVLLRLAGDAEGAPIDLTCRI